MTGETGGGERGGARAWLDGALLRSGWRRRLLLIAAVVLFLALASILRDAVDYRVDPSALVARDAVLCLETRDLPALLGNAAAWPLWNGDLSDGENHIRAAVARAIGEITVEHRPLGDARGGGWFWSLCKLALGTVALLCLILAAAILLLMAGWGGWLKAAAVRAGIRQAEGPRRVEPSAAFLNDSRITPGSVPAVADAANGAPETPPDIPESESTEPESAARVPGGGGEAATPAAAPSPRAGSAAGDKRIARRTDASAATGSRDQDGGVRPKRRAAARKKPESGD